MNNLIATNSIKIWKVILRVIVAAVVATPTSIKTTLCIGYGPF